MQLLLCVSPGLKNASTASRPKNDSLELRCRPGSARMLEQSRSAGKFWTRVQTRTPFGRASLGLIAPGSLLRVSSGPVRAPGANLQRPLGLEDRRLGGCRVARGALPSCRRILDYLGAALTPDELRRDNLVLRAISYHSQG